MESRGPKPFAMNDEEYSCQDDIGVTTKLMFGEFETVFHVFPLPFWPSLERPLTGTRREWTATRGWILSLALLKGQSGGTKVPRTDVGLSVELVVSR